MPKNKKSIFAGGWDAGKAERLAKVQLPEKMRCSICKKTKAISTYSKKQQLDLKNHIALGYDIEHSGIRCRKCTGAQVHEMTCSICSDVKGLEGFSKAQRRNPDKARCIDCVNDHLVMHPGIRNDWEGSEDDEDSNSESEFTTNNGYEDEFTNTEIDGVSSSMNRLNVENVKSLNQVTGSEPANNTTPAPYSLQESQLANDADGSVWRPFSQQNGRSAEGKQATEYTAWDSHGNPHQRARRPSTILSDDYASAKTPASSSKFARVKSDNRAFARAPRGPSPPPNVPKPVSGRQVNYSDSETDSDWGVLD